MKAANENFWHRCGDAACSPVKKATLTLRQVGDDPISFDFCGRPLTISETAIILGEIMTYLSSLA